MSDNLREQLLKSGLASEHEARQAKSESRKKGKRKGKGQAPERSPEADAIKRQEAEKVARDRALAEERERAKREKALRAEISDLIGARQLNESRAETPYHFAADGRARRVRVTSQQRRELARGELACVYWKDRGYVLPRESGERIQARKPDVPVVIHAPPQPGERPEEAEFPVPDDFVC